MSNKKIDLSNFRGTNSKIYSGRDEGIYARKTLGIDALDNDDLKYNVVVPLDTWSINASFFLGLFGESIRKLKEEKFRKKYEFTCTETIEDDIDDGIREALKSSTALGE
ncbi:hypothetical protein [Paenibacillus sp. MMO-58]|uniref:hypothetical protein n=1 Tax=Paenibacillus sp. MMO-58 TaxID=3081290 RepID=UPI00301B1850